MFLNEVGSPSNAYRKNLSWLISTLMPPSGPLAASMNARLPGGQLYHCITQYGLQSPCFSHLSELTVLPSPYFHPHPQQPEAMYSAYFWLQACAPPTYSIWNAYFPPPSDSNTLPTSRLN